MVWHALLCLKQYSEIIVDMFDARLNGLLYLNWYFRFIALCGICFQPYRVLSSVLNYRAFHGCNGPLAKYVKLRVAHAQGMPGTFSPPPRVSDPDMHHGTCVTHVPWCMPGSLTSGFLWSRWRGKRSRHSRRMRNPQFYVSGKRPIVTNWNIVS